MGDTSGNENLNLQAKDSPIKRTSVILSPAKGDLALNTLEEIEKQRKTCDLIEKERETHERNAGGKGKEKPPCPSPGERPNAETERA